MREGCLWALGISHGQQLVPPSAAQPLPRPKFTLYQPSRERKKERSRPFCSVREKKSTIISLDLLLYPVSHRLHLAVTALIPAQTAPALSHSGRSLADSTVVCLPRTISPIKESLSQSLASQENDMQKMLDRKSQRHRNISMLPPMRLGVDTKLH